MLFVSGELNLFKFVFMHCLDLSWVLKRHYRSKCMAIIVIKMSCVRLEKILFFFCCASSVLFNTSVVIKINLFSFRLNGLKSNYFCGELSQVSYC